MTDESLTFSDGVLAGHTSAKGFRVVSADGGAGKVAWASYAPGESYLVVTLGRLSRKHHVVPAGVVTSISDRDVHVGLTRTQAGSCPISRIRRRR